MDISNILKTFSGFVLLSMCSLASSNVALSADKAPAAQLASGFFVGLHAGAGAGNTNWIDGGVGPLGGHVQKGAMGGVIAGYLMPAFDLLVGVEGSLGSLNIKGKHLDGVFNQPGWAGPALEYDQSKARWLVTAAVRAGKDIGSGHVYVKAGLAQQRQNYSLVGYFAPGVTFASTSVNRQGWLLGAGVERVMQVNWSLFAEYNFVQFGNTREHLVCAPGYANCSGPSTTFVPIKISNVGQMVKIGLNYRFGH